MATAGKRAGWTMWVARAVLPILGLGLMLGLSVAWGCGSSGQDSVTAPDPSKQSNATSPPTSTTALAAVTFHSGNGDTTLRVEVARTPAERAKGLMNRASLPADQGMIFVWDKPTRTGFWMKDTDIPLSIAFISGDGVVVDLQDMQAQTEDIHQPARDFQYAVEANLGYFAAHGVKAGDKVDVSGI
jgi:hypothetical protein